MPDLNPLAQVQWSDPDRQARKCVRISCVLSIKHRSVAVFFLPRRDQFPLPKPPIRRAFPLPFCQKRLGLDYKSSSILVGVLHSSYALAGIKRPPRFSAVAGVYRRSSRCARQRSTLGAGRRRNPSIAKPNVRRPFSRSSIFLRRDIRGIQAAWRRTSAVSSQAASA